MQYQHAKYGPQFPNLSEEERNEFLYRLANLHDVAMCICDGNVVDPQSSISMRGTAYFINWSWSPFMISEIGRERSNPEPDFVKFVYDMCERLNLVPYRDDDPKNVIAFETAMKGRMSLTRTTKGKYAFAAQISWEAWLKAKNPGRPNVK